MRILVDMDDVLEYLCIHWVTYLNSLYGTNVTVNDIKSWDISEAFPTIPKEKVYAPIYESNFWNNLIPMAESQYYLRKLIEEKHEVFIVTASNYQTLNSKMIWLFKHFPFLKWNQVIVTSNKQMIEGDVLVDDGVHNLIGGRYHKILFNQPHNSYFNEKEHDIIRVFSWEEVYKTIINLAKSEVKI